MWLDCSEVSILRFYLLSAANDSGAGFVIVGSPGAYVNYSGSEPLDWLFKKFSISLTMSGPAGISSLGSGAWSN